MTRRRSAHCGLETLEPRRLFVGGSLDATFAGDGRAEIDSGGSEFARAMTVDQIGRIIVTGGNTIDAGTPAIRRLLRDGTLDPSFIGPDLPEQQYDFRDVDVLVDGYIMLGGSVYLPQTGGIRSPVVMRLMPDGTLDKTFNGGGYFFPLGDDAIGYVTDIADDPVSGHFSPRYVSGNFKTSADDESFEAFVTLLDGNGRIITSFGEPGVGVMTFEKSLPGFVTTSMAQWGPFPWGAMTLAGWAPGAGAIHPAFVNALGSGSAATGPDVRLLRTASGATLAGTLNAIKPLINGGYIGVGSTGNNAMIVRFNEIGLVDETFGQGGTITVDLGGTETFNDFVLDSSLRVVATGTIIGGPSVGGSDMLLASYLPNGQPEASFNSGRPLRADWGRGETGAAIVVADYNRVLVAGERGATPAATGNEIIVAKYTIAPPAGMPFPPIVPPTAPPTTPTPPVTPPTPEPDPEPAPSPEPGPGPNPDPTQPTPVPTPDPSPEPAPSPDPQPPPAPNPGPLPVPSPEPEPTPEPAPPVPSPEPSPTPDPAPTPVQPPLPSDSAPTDPDSVPLPPVGGAPAPLLQFLTASLPPTAIGGTRVRAKAMLQLTNRSANPVVGQAIVRLLLSADTTADANDAEVTSVAAKLKIAPGKSKRLSLKLPALPSIIDGKYYLLAEVERPGVVAEAIAAATPITVAAPVADVRVNELRLEQPSSPTGMTSTLMSLENLGNVPAQGTFTIKMSAHPADGGEPIALSEAIPVPINLKAGKPSRPVRVKFSPLEGIPVEQYVLKAEVSFEAIPNAANMSASVEGIVAPLHRVPRIGR